MRLHRPLRFAPYYKSVIWGGDKIAHYKGVEIAQDHVGESWEISAVPGFESVVIDDSELSGLKISELIGRYGPEFLGTDVMDREGTSFPLLIKIIDAQSDLSVQVHPADELAMKRHGSKGKTEMWYIIDTEPDANIYTGLDAPLTPEDYTRRIADNTIMDVVGKHHSEPHQFYYVPAGTLHAIGAGNLLAEIQQSSDITYRVYDYDRRDADGNPRELHTELAKDAIDYRYPNHIVPTGDVYDRTTAGAVTSAYFKVDFLKLDTGGHYPLDTHGRTFAILMVTEGEVSIETDGNVWTYPQGTTVLLPAAIGPCDIKGVGNALLVTL